MRDQSPDGFLTPASSALNVDLEQLLAQAPASVDSYFPGHWHRMRELEERGKRIVAEQDFASFVRFLYDAAVLKQPRSDHQWLLAALERNVAEVTAALEALRDVDRLDYKVMDELAKVPGFGRRGGRAFNSAVLRLVRPQSFGIIDWRNLAVLLAAPGFEGLLVTPVSLEEMSAQDVLRDKGNLILTQRVYERYNDALRTIARSHHRSVAEIDLVFWTFSIRKRPFSPFQPRQAAIQQYQITSGVTPVEWTAEGLRLTPLSSGSFRS